MDRARAAGRGLSAGAQIDPGSSAGGTLRAQGYRCYWHGARAYSGVGLHIRRDAFADEPQFRHPAFDVETRIVTAQVGDFLFVSVNVPNGGKDFLPKMESPSAFFSPPAR